MKFQPVFTILLRKSILGISLLSLIVLQIVLFELGIAAWQCPFYAVFNLPCPGCGLTNAFHHLFHFNWIAMFNAHPFAPIFAAGLIVMAFILILPAPYRDRAISSFERMERRTGFSLFILIGLVVFGSIRLILAIF